jgi:hypothetical protein
MTTITDEVLRQAIAIASEGGTPEHPYDQSKWGEAGCGTPCCVWGHACLIAGLEPQSPTGAPPDDTPYARMIAQLAGSSWPDVLRAMRQVRQDGSLTDANLHGANLSVADLRGANLRGANLRDAAMPRTGGAL